MAQEIDLGGTIYISSKRAAEVTGYAQDYIGQLARSGAIDAKRVSGLWYVLEDSLRNHKKSADEFKPVPPQRVKAPMEMEAAVSFDGRDFISAQRAAKITGYHQDYVTQLARSGKVLSRQIGNRWYVDREGLVEHKRHADDLLGAVQAQAVGIEHPKSPEDEASSDTGLHFRYHESQVAGEIPPIPEIPEKQREERVTESEPINNVQTTTELSAEEESRHDDIHEIPIRVIEKTRRDTAVSNQSRKANSEKSNILPRLLIFSAIFIASGVIIYIGLSMAHVPVPQLPRFQAISSESVGERSSIAAQLRSFLSKELIYIRK